MVSPETEVATAVAFAVLAHLLNLIPILVLGVYSAVNVQMDMPKIAREGAEMEEETRGETEDEKSRP